MKKLLTKEYLETKDIETLSEILDEICDYGLGYSPDHIDEIFDEIKRDDETFEPDKADLIDWILYLDKQVHMKKGAK